MGVICRGPGLSGFTVGIALAVMLLVSCATAPKPDPFGFKSAPLFGMIYDYDNRECINVRVLLDGKEHATTDIDGRFVIQALKPGVHRLVATKSGYEPLEVVFNFTSPTQVLYLKMYSFDELLQQAQLALTRGRLADTQRYVDRAAKVRSKDTALSYLQAILALKEKRYSEAAALLDQLVAVGTDDPYVFLFLADLDQYRLNKQHGAIQALQSYLRLADDPSVESRLQTLEATQVKPPQKPGDPSGKRGAK